jgi:hypothetical protein
MGTWIVMETTLGSGSGSTGRRTVHSERLGTIRSCGHSNTRFGSDISCRGKYPEKLFLAECNMVTLVRQYLLFESWLMKGEG